MKFVLIAAVSLLFTFDAFAVTYTVKKGDTLASIARSYYGEPVFGPKGTINKIYQLNPWAKKSSALEPGQTVQLEDKQSSTKSAPQAAPLPVPAPHAEPAVEDNEDETPAAAATITPPPAVEEHISVESKDLPPANAPMPPPPVSQPEPPVVSVREGSEKSLVEKYEDHSEPKAEQEKPPGSLSITPMYTIIKKTAVDAATGVSYVLNSNPAYGAQAAWDHWWNKSFSTVVSYTFTQLSSKEVSDASGAKIANGITLGMIEIALMNRVGNPLRIGLGAAYGDHIFLENFVNVPLDPSVYKTTFFNPFAIADMSVFESEKFAGVLEAKADYLPAQVISGHNLNSGYGFAGQASLTQNMGSFSLRYSVRYETENQTRFDGDETSTRLDFKIGALF